MNRFLLVFIIFLYTVSLASAFVHYNHTSAGSPTGGAVPSGGDALLLESDYYLLLESGDRLLLE